MHKLIERIQRQAMSELNYVCPLYFGHAPKIDQLLTEILNLELLPETENLVRLVNDTHRILKEQEEGQAITTTIALHWAVAELKKRSNKETRTAMDELVMCLLPAQKSTPLTDAKQTTEAILKVVMLRKGIPCPQMHTTMLPSEIKESVKLVQEKLDGISKNNFEELHQELAEAFGDSTVS